MKKKFVVINKKKLYLVILNIMKLVTENINKKITNSNLKINFVRITFGTMKFGNNNIR